MIYVAHRVNTVQELKAIPECYGVEIDIRERGGKLILQHDPFVDGESLEDYLREYRHGLLILNVKCERIEFEVLDLVRKYSIKEYFFLDSSFPMIRLMANKGIKEQAVRYSEYESLETVMAMKGQVNWVWVDCFEKLAIEYQDYQELKNAGFRLCMVSPELQGRPQDIVGYRDSLKQKQIIFDAVCTKVYNIAIYEQ